MFPKFSPSVYLVEFFFAKLHDEVVNVVCFGSFWWVLNILLALERGFSLAFFITRAVKKVVVVVLKKATACGKERLYFFEQGLALFLRKQPLRSSKTSSSMLLFCTGTFMEISHNLSLIWILQQRKLSFFNSWSRKSFFARSIKLLK